MKKRLFYFSLLVIVLLLSSCASNGEEQAGSVESNKQELDALRTHFSPLKEVAVPEDHPMTEDAIELGKVLFFDPRLSGNDELSCASCHVPALGWSDNKPLFEGFEGVEGPRRTPTIINAAYYTDYFWDGRADSLEEQALGPISSPIEMNMELDQLAAKLSQIEGYPAMFEDVYGEEITIDNIAQALASFQRTIVTTDTRFGQFLDGQDDVLTEEEILGIDLFVNEARCITCHNGPHLSDDRFHNVGVESDDIGRKEITERNADDGAFRTSGLYGIAHHAPYMHDGSLETLEDVVDFYNRGGDDHPNKSAMVKELNLTDEEQAALVAFLKTLSDESLLDFDTPDLPGM